MASVGRPPESMIRTSIKETRRWQRNLCRSVPNVYTQFSLIKKILQKLGHNFYSILGWSDGAKTGLLMAIKYPSRINKLVEWGGNAYVMEQEKAALSSVRDLSLWSKESFCYYNEVYGKELKVLCDKHCNHYIKNLDDICRNEVHKIRCPTLSKFM